MFEISVKTRFSAAHHLAGYQGSCAACHGHNWEVEVFVRGSRTDACGMLMDYRALKAHVAGVLAAIDHCDLNRTEAFGSANPTSENIARHIFDELSRRIGEETCRVHRVSVYETPETRASYWEENGEAGA